MEEEDGEELVGDREADVCKLTSDGNNFRDLRLHWLCITEGKSEQMFKEVVLMEVIVALVVDLEEVPYLFRGFGVQDMVLRGMAKSEKKLNLSLFVALEPFLIGLRVSGRVGGRCSAINHIPESLVLKDQGNYLAPVCIVVPIVIKERNLILASLLDLLPPPSP